MDETLFIYEVWTQDHVLIVIAYNEKQVISMVHDDRSTKQERDRTRMFKLGAITNDGAARNAGIRFKVERP